MQDLAGSNLELNGCLNYVQLLESNLQEKSRELYLQIQYNIFTMIIGCCLGLLLAYAFGWRPLRKKS